MPPSAQVVLPLAQNTLNLVDVREHPGAFGILGASLGGLMALYAGLRLPQVFGRVLSQSGVFDFDDYGAVVGDLIHCVGRSGPRVWMDSGRYDSELEGNRRLQRQLALEGRLVGYHEHSSGHNFTAWRNHVALGLEALFPRGQ